MDSHHFRLQIQITLEGNRQQQRAFHFSHFSVFLLSIQLKVNREPGMWDKSLSLSSDSGLHLEHTLCCCDTEKWHRLSMSFLCVSSRQPLAPSLRKKVHPQPAQQCPIHPGPHVQFPAVLRQQQWQCQSSQNHHRWEGF